MRAALICYDNDHPRATNSLVKGLQPFSFHRDDSVFETLYSKRLSPWFLIVDFKAGTSLSDLHFNIDSKYCSHFDL